MHLLAIVIMAAIRVKAQPRKTAPNGSIIAELKSGVRYTLDNPLLKTITICCAVSFILITPAAFLSPLRVARNFGGEVWRLTANEIFWTAGSLLGGAYIAWRGDFHDKVAVKIGRASCRERV